MIWLGVRDRCKTSRKPVDQRKRTRKRRSVCQSQSSHKPRRRSGGGTLVYGRGRSPVLAAQPRCRANRRPTAHGPARGQCSSVLRAVSIKQQRERWNGDCHTGDIGRRPGEFLGSQTRFGCSCVPSGRIIVGGEMTSIVPGNRKRAVNTDEFRHETLSVWQCATSRSTRACFAR